MKVALIFPRFKHRNFGAEPLGLLYLAAILRKNNIELDFFDGTVMEREEIMEKIRQNRYRFVCFSVQTIFADICLEMAKEIKSIDKNIRIVFGGPHLAVISHCPENVDHVLVGEAEIEFLKIIKGEIKDKVVNASPLQDLNVLPVPARDLLDDGYMEQRTPNFMLSRGCPFKCSFCHATQVKMFGLKTRKFTPERAIEELKNSIEVYESKGYGVSKYVFQDDGITYDRDWLKKFCELMIKEDIVRPWVAGTRADTAPDMDLLRLMKESGCEKISIGVESGNDYIRNVILRKELKRERIVETFRRLREAGIKGHCFLIVGSPHESEETIMDTIHLLDEINPAAAQVTVATPIPGTELYDYCVKNGLIEAQNYSQFDYYFESHIKLENFTKEEIEAVRNAMNYAIIFKAFIEERTGKSIKYETLYNFFRYGAINSFVQSLERGKLSSTRRYVQGKLKLKIRN